MAGALVFLLVGASSLAALSPCTGFAHPLLPLYASSPRLAGTAASWTPLAAAAPRGALPLPHQSALGACDGGSGFVSRRMLGWQGRGAGAVRRSLIPMRAEGGGGEDGLLEVTILCEDEKMDAEALSDLLVESGALSACVEDADYGTEEESPIFDEPGEQVWRAMRAQVKLWKRCKVTALFLAGWDVPGVMEMVKESFELEETPKYQLGGVEEKDWVSEVQKNWPPILVGSLLLKFPWHSREELDQIRRDKGMDEKDPELMLEGGMAFGTGEHATTQLCCSWLQKKVHSGMRVLDYGAGSGILGMASLLYGAKEAVGVDIDRDSLLAAASNAKANDLFSSFKCYVPSEEADSVEDNKSPLIPGLGRPGFRIDPSAEDQDVSRIPASAKDFELTVANILAKPLIKLCPEIARLTAPGGLLGLSGVLEEQAGGVMEAYGEYFDDMKVDGVQNGWCLITGVRKA